MISRDDAAKLLDEVLYSRVVECVDMSKLWMIELDLWVALCERERGSEEEARAEARDMIDRALARLGSARDRYAELQPYGVDCRDCEEERAEAVRQSRRS